MHRTKLHARPPLGSQLLSIHMGSGGQPYCCSLQVEGQAACGNAIWCLPVAMLCQPVLRTTPTASAGTPTRHPVSMSLEQRANHRAPEALPMITTAHLPRRRLVCCLPTEIIERLCAVAAVAVQGQGVGRHKEG